MALVNQWVRDKLHEVFGMSDKHVAEYLINLATKSRSTDDFIQQVKHTGVIDVDATFKNFGEELWEKVGIWNYFWHHPSRKDVIELLKTRFLRSSKAIQFLLRFLKRATRC